MSTATKDHPTTGGRVVLDLEGVGDAEIVYAATLYTPDAEYRGRARMAAEDGAVTWAAWEPAGPPAWLVELAQAFLRGAWRARRGADAEPWPQRINRWRESPRG